MNRLDHPTIRELTERWNDGYAEGYRAGVQHERERCAKLAEQFKANGGCDFVEDAAPHTGAWPERRVSLDRRQERRPQWRDYLDQYTDRRKTTRRKA